MHAALDGNSTRKLASCPERSGAPHPIHWLPCSAAPSALKHGLCSPHYALAPPNASAGTSTCGRCAGLCEQARYVCDLAAQAHRAAAAEPQHSNPSPCAAAEQSWSAGKESRLTCSVRHTTASNCSSPSPPPPPHACALLCSLTHSVKDVEDALIIFELHGIHHRRRADARGGLVRDRAANHLILQPGSGRARMEFKHSISEALPAAMCNTSSSEAAPGCGIAPGVACTAGWMLSTIQANLYSHLYYGAHSTIATTPLPSRTFMTCHRQSSRPTGLRRRQLLWGPQPTHPQRLARYQQGACGAAWRGHVTRHDWPGDDLVLEDLRCGMETCNNVHLVVCLLGCRANPFPPPMQNKGKVLLAQQPGVRRGLR